MTTSVVGRQPIVDRERDLVGYELLFRSLPDSATADDDIPATMVHSDQLGDAMSTVVFFSAMDIGITRTVGDKLMFCNADRGVLTGRVDIVLPPEQTVIEVLEDVTIDDEVLRGCRALKEAGFRLAADDFRLVPGAERLLDLVDIVKIDIQATPAHEVTDLITRCRRSGVQLLAEKVETDAELERCLDLGFELFQGYLLGRPDTLTSPALGASRIGVVRLAEALLRGDADFDDLEDILRAEPSLAYRLLQIASIGRLGEFRRDIRSLREALITVGLSRMRGWLPALLLRPSGAAIDTALPGILGRARMAETLASLLYPGEAGFAFAAGMLSAFGVLLGVPREDLPEILQVPEDLRAAAFDGQGAIGELVNAIIDYEYDRPESLQGMDHTIVDSIAARSFSWAIQVTEGLDSYERF